MRTIVNFSINLLALLALSCPALSSPTLEGLRQLKRDEGFTPWATYLPTQDGGRESVRTVGYGYNIDAAKDPVTDLILSGVCEREVPLVLSGSTPITKEQADNLFLLSALRAYDSANRVVKDFMDLEDRVRDVLMNMAFQLGATGLSRFKRMLEALQEEDYERASLEILESRLAEAQSSNRAERLAMQLRGAFDVQ